jgi:hypothetical protein
VVASKFSGSLVVEGIGFTKRVKFVCASVGFALVIAAASFLEEREKDTAESTPLVVTPKDKRY